VRVFPPFDDFKTPSVPRDIDTYREYRRLSIEFIEARNRRIQQQPPGPGGVEAEIADIPDQADSAESAGERGSVMCCPAWATQSRAASLLAKGTRG